MIGFVFLLLILTVATQWMLSGSSAFDSGQTLAVLFVPMLLSIGTWKEKSAEGSGKGSVLFLAGFLWIAVFGVLPNPSGASLLKVLVPVVLSYLAYIMSGGAGASDDGVGDYFVLTVITGFAAAVVADVASIGYGLVFASLAVVSAVGCIFKKARPTVDCRLVQLLKKSFFLAITASVIFGAVPLSIGGILMAFFTGIGAFKAVRSLRLAALMILPVLLLSCLQPSGEPFKPASVTFQLNSEGMNLLLTENWRVRVRVHKIEQGNRGNQEGNDHLFTASDSNPSFRIDNIKLGLKDFVLDIINESNESIGHGESRYLVRPGAQSLPEIRIKLVPPDLRRRELPMNWIVRMKTTGQDPKTTYQDIKQVFSDHCLSCHSSDSRPEPAGKLVLSEFPFYYTNAQHDMAAIVRDSIFWMKAADYPMPPPPMTRVAPTNIDLVQKWVDDGLLKFPMSDNTSDLAHKINVTWQLDGTSETGTWSMERPAEPDEPFNCKLEQAVVGGKYKLRVEVMAVDGSMVVAKDMEYTVSPNGEALMEIELEGGDPSVTIPIIIER